MRRPLKGEALRQAVLTDDPTPQVYDNQLMFQHELMEIFEITERTLYNWRRRSILRFVKIGGCIYYKLGDVRRMSQTYLWDNRPQ